MSRCLPHNPAMLCAAIFAIAFSSLALPCGAAAETLDRQAVRQELEILKQRITDLERLLEKEEQAEATGAGGAGAQPDEGIEPVAVEPSATGEVEISTAGSTMTVGGQVRLDAAYNNPAGPSNFGMGASAIPSTADAQGERGHFSMVARNSRLWFKTATPLGEESLRTLIEIDFWGSSGAEKVSNSHNIRLRHAYAEYGGFTLGQTNSTFMHSGTTPELISDSAGDVFVRQPLIRYTRPFDGGNFQIALEQPETALTDITGTQIIPDDDRFPDLAAKLSWTPAWGQLSVSGVLRQLRIDTGGAALGAVPAGVTDQALGGALFVSARVNLWGADNLRFGHVIGNALGRYIAYNSFDDAAIDAAGNIRLQRAMGGFGAFQHWWNDNWHSSFVFLRSQIDNDLTILPLTAFHYIQSWHANLLWSPLVNTSMGIEYIHASTRRESGERARLQRMHFSAVYKF